MFASCLLREDISTAVMLNGSLTGRERIWEIDDVRVRQWWWRVIKMGEGGTTRQVLAEGRDLGGR